MIINRIDSCNSVQLFEIYKSLEKDIVWTSFGPLNKQAGLQYLEQEDPWTSAVGKSKGRDIEYTALNTFFQNTEFENIIHKYNLKRTRFMWVGPYTCYSMHKDISPRIHIPIITNPSCYFVFETGGIVHLESDGVYWLDTRFNHTFMNCSDQHRLHLVGVVNE